MSILTNTSTQFISYELIQKNSGLNQNLMYFHHILTFECTQKIKLSCCTGLSIKSINSDKTEWLNIMT
jgi:hypothetical protein